MSKFSRRTMIKGFAASAALMAAGGAASRRAVAAPNVAKGTVFTVSTWGGTSQAAVKNRIGEEFERATGATIAYDVGILGTRYSKLIAQRANPTADIFFCSDEALASGLAAGVLDPVRKKSLSNLPEVADWSMSVKSPSADTVAGVPYAMIALLMAYNPEKVKTAPTSWNDLWNPDFAGKFSLISPAHSVMPPFLQVISEMNGGSATNIAPGLAKLAQLRPGKLHVVYPDWAGLLKSGEIIMATELTSYLDVMRSQGYPIEYAVPKEKGIGLMNFVGVIKGTKNTELAEYFLDLTISQQGQLGLASDLYISPINAKLDMPSDLKKKCFCGDQSANLRFFDPAESAKVRPMWTERLMTEVVPQWKTR